jgi:hypothetical protein
MYVRMLNQMFIMNYYFGLDHWLESYMGFCVRFWTCLILGLDFGPNFWAQFWLKFYFFELHQAPTIFFFRYVISYFFLIYGVQPLYSKRILLFIQELLTSLHKVKNQQFWTWTYARCIVYVVWINCPSRMNIGTKHW